MLKTRPTRTRQAMEVLAKGKHLFQAALQWSAVLLNRTKARIKPLFELNKTAARSLVAIMECLLFQPHPHKKNTCRMLEGEKNNMQARTHRKKFHRELRC